MKIFWSIDSIPEIRELDFFAKDELWGKCWRRSFRRWQTWLGALLMLLLLVILWMIGNVLHGPCISVWKILWRIGTMTVFSQIFNVVVLNLALPCIKEEVKLKAKASDTTR